MAYESDSSAGAADLGGSYSGPRWSYALARPPGWLSDAPAAVVDYYKQRVFDRGEGFDVNAELDRIEQATRAEASRIGVRVSDDTGGVLRLAAELELGLTSWAAHAGAAGSATPSGPGALSTPYLDVIAANAAARIGAVRDLLSASGAEFDSTEANVLATAASLGMTGSLSPGARTTFLPANSPVGAGNLNPAAAAAAGISPNYAPVDAFAAPSFAGPSSGLFSGGNNTIILLAVAAVAVYLYMDSK